MDILKSDSRFDYHYLFRAKTCTDNLSYIFLFRARYSK